MDERDLLDEMLEFIATEMDELGNHEEIAHIERILREGTGADRQLAVWERTHDLKAVVDHIIEETCTGLTLNDAFAAASNLREKKNDCSNQPQFDHKT